MAWFHLPHTNCMMFPLLKPAASYNSVHFRVHIPSPGHQMCHCSFAAKQSVSRNKTWKQYCGTQNLITWMWCTLRCTLHYVNVWGPLSVATDTFTRFMDKKDSQFKYLECLWSSSAASIYISFLILQTSYLNVQDLRTVYLPPTSIHGWW